MSSLRVNVQVCVPLQLVDLDILVILLILHLSEDFQEPVHLGLCLPSILLVTRHLLLKCGNAFRQSCICLSLNCDRLSL